LPIRGRAGFKIMIAGSSGGLSETYMRANSEELE
jgi:hypothetical protein